jgi:peptidoglycan/LPS O-acetylase OafA/YrhL
LEDEHIKIVEGGNKYLYLEGIRGFGAYAVYNSHFSGEFYDTFFNRDQNATVSSWYLRVIFASPINILLNGSFWVGPFFLLSGLVITISWYKNRR